MVPRVSVVMATYNQARYIQAALDSIRNQTFTDFELIVVNDGCTDETPAILRGYQCCWPFILLDQANQGQARSLNNGFAVAQGEYLTWTSSDNILLPHMLTTLVSALDGRQAVGLVYSDWDVIDGEGQLTHHVHTVDYDRLKLLRHNFVNASFLYRRSCQQCVGPMIRPSARNSTGTIGCVSRALGRFGMCRRRCISTGATWRGSHMQPDADRQYQYFAKTWRHREPLNWYAAKVRAWRQRRSQGQESKPTWEPVGDS